jgi:hypothetical protein
VPAVPVPGAWDSEPVGVLSGDSETGEFGDSELVWALAGKASIAPTAATASNRQYVRKVDMRTLDPRGA